MPPIDLRSDTVTLPTPAMRQAMQDAVLADEALEGDPTVAALEAAGARLAGKPAALFVASGTMGNLVCALAHASRGGGEALVDADAHIARSEGGGLANLAGLMCTRLPGRHGRMDLDRVRDALRGGFERYGPPTAMVVIETSHNHSGGRVPGVDYMRELHGLCAERGVAVHMDGARSLNAARALGLTLDQVAAHADSITFCLSKGLSAPMGSIVAGDLDFITRARTFRRMVGGGLRQIGGMAAAGLVALDTMVERLDDDHRRTRRLWEGLRALDPVWTDDPPETNLLMLDVGPWGGAAAWQAALERAGVRVRARDAATLRMVVHRHIDDAAVDRALQAVADQLALVS